MILKDIEIDRFIQLVKQKKLICFGAGQGLQTFCNKFADYHIEEHIAFIVDNDPRKWGTRKCYRSKDIEIISPEQFRHNFKQNNILLITCLDLDSILMQLNTWHEFAECECYFYSYILYTYYYKQALSVDIPQNYKFALEQQIPKVIHYCWFGKNSLPERYKEWIKSWKKYCPDYEIVEWNEGNYDITKNEYMRQAYESKKWGFVPDYARLDIIYEHGGIYLDTDVELIRNLDDFLYQEGFCGFQYDLMINFGLGFGAIKKLPIIKELRDQYEHLIFKNDDGKLNITVSPEYQTSFLVNRGLKLNGEFQKIEKLRIYPVTFFCGIMGSGKKTIITENTFSLHHFDGSWVESEEKEKKEMIRTLYADIKK